MRLPSLPALFVEISAGGMMLLLQKECLWILNIN